MLIFGLVKYVVSVGMGGFEPPTSPSRTVRATNCATSRNNIIEYYNKTEYYRMESLLFSTYNSETRFYTVE